MHTLTNPALAISSHTNHIISAKFSSNRKVPYLGFRRLHHPVRTNTITRSKFTSPENPHYSIPESQLGSRIRAICFYAVNATAIPLFVIMLLVHPLVVLFDQYRRRFHHCIAKVWALMTIAPFYRLELEGLENLPSRDDPVVYVSNHQSFLDVYTLLTLGRNFKFISKTGIFVIPVVGWAMFLMGLIPIRRMDSRSHLDCLKRCMYLVQRGASVIFFPEGTRSRDGKLGPFKKGAFSVAAKTEVPVVPITLLGTGKLMPPRMEGVLNSGSVKVIIHKPIVGRNADILCNEARNAIADTLVRHGYEIMVKEEAKPVEAKAVEKKEDEQKKDEDKKEEKKEEDKKPDDSPPPPPPPPPVVVLHVDLHCVGCVKKIERCLLRCKGVEEVESDMAKNQVKIKGVVDPQALCSRIEKKTMRSAKVVSPAPPPDHDSTHSQVIASQVELTTVEFHVNMHCEACAQQLRKKILKLRGVQAAETELSSGKLTVTGTMSSDKIIDYIHKRTGKLAKVIPPPQPPPPPPPPPAPPKEEEEKKNDEGEKTPEEKPPQEKKEDNNAPQEKIEEDQKVQAEAATEEGKDKGEGSKEGEKKEGESGPNHVEENEMVMKKMMYWNGGYNPVNYHGGYNHMNYFVGQEEMGNRHMVGPWMPVYFVERQLPPPPQLFSDENPHACCIS